MTPDMYVLHHNKYIIVMIDEGKRAAGCTGDALPGQALSGSRTPGRGLERSLICVAYAIQPRSGASLQDTAG
ncbi:MAG: hypothetical protein WCX22_12510 [Methanoregula sp.]